MAAKRVLGNDPFKRGAAARVPGRPGAGLGLAIAQAVAEAHLGSVTVRNVGGGCVFELRLPSA